MIRPATLALLAVMSVVTGASAQQPPSVVAGKWEVTITGRAVRLLDLVADGTTVAGTLTKDGADAAAVTGELKSSYSGKSLTLETKAGDEFFYVAVDGERLHGTYIFNGGSPEKSFKTGVVMKRPVQR